MPPGVPADFRKAQPVKRLIVPLGFTISLWKLCVNAWTRELWNHAPRSSSVATRASDALGHSCTVPTASVRGARVSGLDLGMWVGRPEFESLLFYL